VGGGELKFLELYLRLSLTLKDHTLERAEIAYVQLQLCSVCCNQRPADLSPVWEYRIVSCGL
jgi:hypothetical protein